MRVSPTSSSNCPIFIYWERMRIGGTSLRQLPRFVQEHIFETKDSLSRQSITWILILKKEGLELRARVRVQGRPVSPPFSGNIRQNPRIYFPLPSSLCFRRRSFLEISLYLAPISKSNEIGSGFWEVSHWISSKHWATGWVFEEENHTLNEW